MRKKLSKARWLLFIGWVEIYFDCFFFSISVLFRLFLQSRGEIFQTLPPAILSLMCTWAHVVSEGWGKWFCDINSHRREHKKSHKWFFFPDNAWTRNKRGKLDVKPLKKCQSEKSDKTKRQTNKTHIFRDLYCWFYAHH